MNEIKKFKSKRNDVYLVEIDDRLIIKKTFNNESSYRKEKDFYQSVLIHGECKVSKLINYDDDEYHLILEYLNGETVLAFVEKCELEQDHDQACLVIMCVINWLEQFSQIDYIKYNGLCYYDVNLRNFIYFDGTIYGIDFEEVQRGSTQQDIVKVLAMYLNYDPVSSDFKCRVCERISRYLVDRGWFDHESLNRYIREETRLIIKRRGNK